MRTETPNSSNLAWFEYKPDEKELHVGFQHGGEGHYSDVSQERYDALKAIHEAGGSVGSHLHRNIKPLSFLVKT